MQLHLEASCGTGHCAYRPSSCHPLLHFHSNFLRTPLRHPFQGIENRERHRLKNAFVDRGAAPVYCTGSFGCSEVVVVVSLLPQSEIEFRLVV